MSLTFQEQRALEIFKSLTEISVSGFRTLALLNGGGVLAIVTYLGHANLPKQLPSLCVVGAMICYVLGLVCCGVAYFTAHGTNLSLFNEAILALRQPGQPFPQPHRKWLRFARVAVALSIGLFLAGSLTAVAGLLAAR